MSKKTKGAGKPAPKGDTTQKRRQSRRRERLNEIAKALGFASWSAYETACLNGVAKPNNSVQRTGLWSCLNGGDMNHDVFEKCQGCETARR